VHGWRRWRYTVDTALKAPLLAREYQRAPLLPPRWLTGSAGAALVVTPFLVVGSVYLGATRVEVILLMLLAPVPTVAARSFLLATRRGGGVRFAGAAALTAAVVVGPIGTINAVFTDRGDWTAVGASLLGTWLVWVNVGILRRRAGAADQAVLGVTAGVSIALLSAVSLVTEGMMWGFVLFGIVATVPLLALWCLMAGARMLVGRTDLVVDSDAGRPDRGVEVGG
jgi:hypothetical protein